jgi:hypothetical protein
MKLFLSIAVAIALLPSCGFKKNDVTRYGYKGDIEQVTTYKYANFSGTLDSANFSFRTVYDYNTDGNVHFMQFVLNRNMFNQPSIGINYLYKFEDGQKVAWTEHNLNENDSSSKGKIEWPDDRTLVEKSFGPTGDLNYEIRTLLNDKGYEENVQIFQYQAPDTTPVYNQIVTNVLEDGQVKYRIHKDLLKDASDTVYIENIETDKKGNVTRCIETNSRTGQKDYVLKVFRYKED